MRRIPFLVALLTLIVAACTGGDDGTSTPSATPTASVTSTSTTVPTSTSEPTSAPTETATPTATPGPVTGPAAGQRYGVAKVRNNDPDGGLNLRSAPAGSEVLGVIPFDAADLIATGDTAQPDDSTWYEVTYGGTTGWVSSDFVVRLPSFDDLSCGDASTDYTSAGGVPQDAAVVDRSADHVLAMHQYEDGECQRTVITFGRDFDFDRDLAGTLMPATGVPENLAVAVNLASLAIRLPDSVIAAATTATDSFQLEDGLADLLFFRRPTSGFGVAVLFEANRAARVTALSSPGQLVIDTIDAPTGTGLDLGPLLGGLTVLRHPINTDVNGPPPEPPIVLSGFSRPFEASGVAVLRSAPLEGEDPGSGDPVSADWSGGVLGDTCDSLYGFMTTDYIEAWGAFEFTIEALAPGTYELFVGEFSAQDGSELGVYDVFTVGGTSAASC